MKNIIIAILLMAALPLCAQTTQEEYNYLTKGYKTQIESGLDMKKGYKLIDYGVYEIKEGNQTRQCEFKGLIKDGQTKPCAVLMIFKRTDLPNGAVYYICIPSANANESIWKQTNDLVKSITDASGLYRAFINGLMRFSAQLSQ
jgi:hypothetical protein